METIREATIEDEDFLRQMAARFKRGTDERLFKGFGTERTDFGFVAVVDGELAGAAWCRRAFAARIEGTNEDYGVRPKATSREPFLGVRTELEGNGIGGRLLNRLIDYAYEDRGVHVLVAHPTKRSDEMLTRRHFAPNRGGKRLLHVRGPRPLETS